MKFQLIAVEYTGLKFTKGVFNPKPKALEEGGGLQNLYLQIMSNIKMEHAQMTLKNKT